MGPWRFSAAAGRKKGNCLKDRRKLVSGKGASNERLQCGRQLGQRRLSSARKAKVTPFSEKQIDLC